MNSSRDVSVLTLFGRHQQMVGEVARGLSLFGGASSEVRRCNCSVVDESCSSLAGLDARCVSFLCLSTELSIYLSIDKRDKIR